jgi:hypothetical protein
MGDKKQGAFPKAKMLAPGPSAAQEPAFHFINARLLEGLNEPCQN